MSCFTEPSGYEKTILSDLGTAAAQLRRLALSCSRLGTPWH
jgi:hypothetical protein